MPTPLADHLVLGDGQGWMQVAELLVAFLLTALVGLEREVRGKSAGMRTQAIVGTSSALILLISKYGFDDVLVAGHVVLDPSRVAAQIVSGIGFLGAGLIITRHGAVRGLTTAAAVWESSAIGMASGAGLVLLALVVTALHFVIVLGFSPLKRRLPGAFVRSLQVHVTYQDQRGVLRQLLAACGARGWTLTSMSADPPGATDLVEAISPAEPGVVGVVLSLTGTRVQDAAHVLAGVEGVTAVGVVDEESEEG